MFVGSPCANFFVWIDGFCVLPLRLCCWSAILLCFSLVSLPFATRKGHACGCVAGESRRLGKWAMVEHLARHNVVKHRSLQPLSIRQRPTYKMPHLILSCLLFICTFSCFVCTRWRPCGCVNQAVTNHLAIPPLDDQWMCLVWTGQCNSSTLCALSAFSVVIIILIFIHSILHNFFFCLLYCHFKITKSGASSLWQRWLSECIMW